MKNHRLLCFLILLLAALSLLSCGSDNNRSDHSHRTNPPATTEETSTDTAAASETEDEGSELISDTVEPEETESLTPTEDELSSEPEPEISYKGLTITALNVGQGLSLLINADDHLMLYDGGGRKSSSYVVSYLKQHDCTAFDYMVVSHYDEDHIAGLIGCLHNYSFDQVICPDYEAQTDIYQSFINGLAVNGAEIVHPKQNDEYSLGNAFVTVLGPSHYENAKDNNNSIVLRIVYGDFSCIITGDAETEEENAILASGTVIKSDLYVVGHHGSAYSSSEDFVRAISPQAAIISCGEYNDYGHPSIETITLLEQLGIDIYRTDKQAEISCTSDANTFTFSVEPCADHSSGSEPLIVLVPSDGSDAPSEVTKDIPEVSVDTTKESNSTTYILNTNTMKFHYPNCKSVKQMKDKNKKEVEATREDLINRGYDPCGNCHP